MIVLLDGPVGTELAARGVATPPPLWSAAAIDAAPDVLAAIHRDYAAAGATVHTAATFRASPRAAGPRFRELAARAVAIARAAVPSSHRVAGSLAPLEDCYRPELSPRDAGPEHEAMARALADAGVDLLLCETFPHAGEARVAVERAARTGLPVWVSFTAGPDGSRFTPAAMRAAARRVVDAGASVVLCNCVAATRTLPFVEALEGLGVPFGAYANAGDPGEALGWVDAAPGETKRAAPLVADGTRERAADAYAQLAARWLEAGATVLGACCGTGPAHVAALAELARARASDVTRRRAGTALQRPSEATSVRRMIQAGDKAPNFNLPNDKKEMVSLESLKGKTVVLAFYPAAFTGVCTKEMCRFTDSLTELNGLNAAVLGVSVDGPFTNAAFAEKNKIGFPLLSDYLRDATKAYGVALDDFAGLPGYTASKRAVFVIDGAGTVKYEWVGPNPGVEPDYDAVKKAVAALA